MCYLATRVTRTLQGCQKNGWTEHKDECGIFREVQWFVTRNWESGANAYAFPVEHVPWRALEYH